jgi:hypothetical protein
LAEETTRILLIRHASNDYVDTDDLPEERPGFISTNEAGKKPRPLLSAWRLCRFGGVQQPSGTFLRLLVQSPIDTV